MTTVVGTSTAVVVSIVWVALGLIVFAIVLRATRGGDPEAGESAAQRHGVSALVVLAFVFGLVAPTLVLAHNGEKKASEAPGGVHLTASETKGRELFSHACNLCHTLAAANAVGRIGPNLDVLLSEVPTDARKALVLETIREGVARGNGQMPPELYQGKEAQDVAAFVAAVAGH